MSFARLALVQRALELPVRLPAAVALDDPVIVDFARDLAELLGVEFWCVEGRVTLRVDADGPGTRPEGPEWRGLFQALLLRTDNGYVDKCLEPLGWRREELEPHAFEPSGAWFLGGVWWLRQNGASQRAVSWLARQFGFALSHGGVETYVIMRRAPGPD